MIAGLLGICAAGSIPLAAQPAAIVQPLELETLVGAESANPQWGYGQQLGGFGGIPFGPTAMIYFNLFEKHYVYSL